MSLAAFIMAAVRIADVVQPKQTWAAVVEGGDSGSVSDELPGRPPPR